MSDFILNHSSNTSPFDAIRHFETGVEFWLARELMPLLGYSKWQRFQDAISRAIVSCSNSNAQPDKHFMHLPGSVSGSGRTGDNYKLSRHACHLIVMAGDPRKPQIAVAQEYFSAKIHEAEQANQQNQLSHTSLINCITQIASAMGKVYGAHYEQSLLRHNFERHFPMVHLLEPSPLEMPSYPTQEALLTPTDIASQLEMYYSTGSPNPQLANKALQAIGFQEKVGKQWSPVGKGLEHSVRKPVNTGGRTDKDQLFWHRSVIDVLRAVGY